MSDRAANRDVGMLLLAVLSISSAPILARWADAPALALTFWRTLAGAILLAPGALRSPSRPSRAHAPALALAGMALALHFSMWLGSVERTSVAAAVTLGGIAPLFVGLWVWSRGRAAGRATEKRVWLGLAMTLLGALVITGDDAVAHSGHLGGDAMALLASVGMAAYLVTGDRLRGDLSTAAYAAPTYAIAAVSVLIVSLATGTQLTGFDGNTWIAIIAMTLGPQLCGHTVLNALLPRLGSVLVSSALLIEPIGASLLAWLFLNEAPLRAVYLGTPIVLAGLALQILASEARPVRPRGSSSEQ